MVVLRRSPDGEEELQAILGGIWTLPTEWSVLARASEAWTLVWWVCVAGFLCCTLAALFTRRLQFLNVFDLLKGWFARLLRRRWLPSLEVGERSD